MNAELDRLYSDDYFRVLMGMFPYPEVMGKVVRFVTADAIREYTSTPPTTHTHGIEAMLDAIAQQGYADDSAGDVMEMGWHKALMRGPISIIDILEQEVQGGIRLDVGDVPRLMKMAGAIIRVDEFGFLGASIYDTEEDLEAAWKDVQAEEAEWYRNEDEYWQGEYYYDRIYEDD